MRVAASVHANGARIADGAVQASSALGASRRPAPSPLAGRTPIRSARAGYARRGGSSSASSRGASLLLSRLRPRLCRRLRFGGRQLGGGRLEQGLHVYAEILADT